MKNLNTYLTILFFYLHISYGFSQFFEPLNGPNGLHTYELIVSSEGHIFISSYSGLFHSKDEGVNWELIVDGLSRNRVRELTTSPSGDIYMIQDNTLQNLLRHGQQLL